MPKLWIFGKDEHRWGWKGDLMNTKITQMSSSQEFIHKIPLKIHNCQRDLHSKNINVHVKLDYQYYGWCFSIKIYCFSKSNEYSYNVCAWKDVKSYREFEVASSIQTSELIDQMFVQKSNNDTKCQI